MISPTVNSATLSVEKPAALEPRHVASSTRIDIDVIHAGKRHGEEPQLWRGLDHVGGERHVGDDGHVRTVKATRRLFMVLRAIVVDP